MYDVATETVQPRDRIPMSRDEYEALGQVSQAEVMFDPADLLH